MLLIINIVVFTISSLSLAQPPQLAPFLIMCRPAPDQTIYPFDCLLSSQSFTSEFTLEYYNHYSPHPNIYTLWFPHPFASTPRLVDWRKTTILWPTTTTPSSLLTSEPRPPLLRCTEKEKLNEIKSNTGKDNLCTNTHNNNTGIRAEQKTTHQQQQKRAIGIEARKSAIGGIPQILSHHLLASLLVLGTELVQYHVQRYHSNLLGSISSLARSSARRPENYNPGLGG